MKVNVFSAVQKYLYRGAATTVKAIESSYYSRITAIDMGVFSIYTSHVCETIGHCSLVLGLKFKQLLIEILYLFIELIVDMNCGNLTLF